MQHIHARLTEGSVRRHLVELTRPMVWGILAIMAFNATDTWFVAQLGARELAAISFTFPVVMVLISFGIGLMAGTSSVLARAIGEGNQQNVRRVTTDALVLAIVLSLAITLVGLLTLNPLFRLLGASDDLLPLVRDYMVIWYAGFASLLVSMVGMGAIRATGDSKFQSRVMIGAAVVNLILDPLLIFGLLGFPRLELKGAAIATVAARVMMLFVGFYALQFRTHMISYRPPAFTAVWRSWKDVLHVGLPAAGTNIIIPVSTGIVIAIIAGFGSDAVAGFGVASRVEAIALVSFYAMSAVIGPFVGQNLGAGRPERVTQAIKISALFCVSLGVLLVLVLGVGAEMFIRLFNDEPEVVAVGAAYLWIVPISFGAAGIIMVVNAAFNGLGRPFPAVVISLTRMMILYVPLAYAGAKLFGVDGIFVAASFANLAVGVLAYLWGSRVCQQQLEASKAQAIALTSSSE
ncbi:MAG: MATE family efflux transporter [Acidiferrobacterales bacterium]